MPCGACWALCGLLLAPVALFGHGTEYEVLAGGVVGVRALFDTGQPMAEAPVLVFAPDRPGAWVLQVRAEDGHGVRINLEVDPTMRLRGFDGSIPTLEGFRHRGVDVLAAVLAGLWIALLLWLELR